MNGLTERALAPFADEQFSAREALRTLRTTLLDTGYVESVICDLLGVESLQQVEPTCFPYYSRFVLPESELGDLIRIFLLRIALSPERLKVLFGSKCLDSLIRLGLLRRRGGKWASAIDLHCADDLFIATDNGHAVHGADQLDEAPVRFMGLDSLGLLNIAPRYAVKRALDLRTGSGVQALVASRYADQVIAIDINPRAVRFARFNANLNDIYNVRFIVGDLYGPLVNAQFDLILANATDFVDPGQEPRFGDSCTRADETLLRIISESSDYLREGGRLHVVAEGSDASDYEKKLDAWWSGGPAHTLVLRTARRHEARITAPWPRVRGNRPSRPPNDDLLQKITSFRQVNRQAMEFSYICIHRLSSAAVGSYYMRTIDHPYVPIYEQVARYFEQREAIKEDGNKQLFLRATENLQFRIEFRIDEDHRAPQRHYQLFVPNNPYHTTYTVSEEVFRGLELILRRDVQLSELAGLCDQEWILDLIYRGLVHVTSDPLTRSNCRKCAPVSKQEVATDLAKLR